MLFDLHAITNRQLKKLLEMILLGEAWKKHILLVWFLFSCELLFCGTDNSFVRGSTCMFSTVIPCDLDYVRGLESLCVNPSLLRRCSSRFSHSSGAPCHSTWSSDALKFIIHSHIAHRTIWKLIERFSASELWMIEFLGLLLIQTLNFVVDGYVVRLCG